ncbi:MAG: tetratricopeptide repeat protein, partial [Bacteroidales bacterium]|nr:tetratricopeptide repeat protein [Bacteroidales bacterium]
MKNIYKILSLIFITNFLFCFSILAQDIPSNIKDELTGYETKIEQYKNENNTQLELEYLNKAAFLCWNNQLYNKAVDHFNRVIELNKQSGNQNGIMLSSNYVGMIYDEIQDYNSAITYFKKGLEISRKLNNNKNITSSLINIS